VARISIRRYKYDWLVALGILLVVVGIYGSVIYGQTSRLNEEALIYELRALRYAATTFYFMNDRYPNNIKELTVSVMNLSRGRTRFYLPKKFRDKDVILDPFGNPYIYDADTGWTTSSTKSYVDW